MVQGSKSGSDYLNLAGTLPKEMKCRKMTSRIFWVEDCMHMEVVSM